MLDIANSYCPTVAKLAAYTTNPALKGERSSQAFMILDSGSA
jgi:hypothetical protein